MSRVSSARAVVAALIVVVVAAGVRLAGTFAQESQVNLNAADAMRLAFNEQMGKRVRDEALGRPGYRGSGGSRGHGRGDRTGTGEIGGSEVLEVAWLRGFKVPGFRSSGVRAVFCRHATNLETSNPET